MHRSWTTAWVAVLLAAASLAAAAQRKPALPQKYARWLNQDVVYIISDEEKKAFLQLPSDEARETFIKDFWDIRNPLRGSEQNPFKEEHYKRIQYANDNFGRESGTPGWMTDMGRTYIELGKPDSRAPYKGYSQMYPLELWMYANKTGSPSLPSHFYVLFFMPEDIGDYRFYHPIIDGPMKLVRGTQFNTNKDVYDNLKRLSGELAHAAFSLNPSDPVDTTDFTPNMSGEMIVSKIREFRNDSFEVKRLRELRNLKERVTSWFLVAQQQAVELTSLVLSDPAGYYWLDYGVLVDDPKFGRVDASGLQLTVQAEFRLLTETGELIVEDAEQRAYPAFDKSSGEKRFKPFVLANRVPLVPGKYKLEVQLVNREAGRVYKAEKIISAGGPAAASLEGPLLIAAVQQVAAPDPNTPFQYFGVQFLPAIDKRFAPGGQIRTLYQLHVPAGAPRDYEMEYVLASPQDREMRRTYSDKVAFAEFRNGSLLKSKAISLAELSPGDYRAVINLRAVGSPVVLASSIVPFKIEDVSKPPAIYFLANYRDSTRNGVAAYIRGLESISFKNDQKAQEYLEQAFQQSPANSFISRALVLLYFSAHKFDRVTALYDRSAVTPLNSGTDTMAQVALSFWQRGDREKARRVLEAAKAVHPRDSLLLAAAKTIEQPVPSATH